MITEQDIKESFEKNGIHFVNRSWGLNTVSNVSLQTLVKVVKEAYEKGFAEGKDMILKDL